MTNAVAVWFANNLGHIMPAELVCFIVSLFPILECRGGLIVAKLLGVNLLTARIRFFSFSRERNIINWSIRLRHTR